MAAEVPVLVELFTSEGCSSCPPADALLDRLARAQPIPGAHIVALAEHVDYWDGLGWKDPFASAAFTERQERYARALESRRVYTPQLVVDGRTDVLGTDEEGARAAIAAACREPHATLALSYRAPVLRLSSADLPRGEPADAFVAVTEDGLTSRVLRGENEGRTLAHSAVVRWLRVAGSAIAPAYTAEVKLDLDPRWNPDKLRAVAFIQARRSRRLFAAAALQLTRPE